MNGNEDQNINAVKRSRSRRPWSFLFTPCTFLEGGDYCMDLFVCWFLVDTGGTFSPPWLVSLLKWIWFGVVAAAAAGAVSVFAAFGTRLFLLDWLDDVSPNVASRRAAQTPFRWGERNNTISADLSCLHLHLVTPRKAPHTRPDHDDSDSISSPLFRLPASDLSSDRRSTLLSRGQAPTSILHSTPLHPLTPSLRGWQATISEYRNIGQLS
ncbi:hypothetical protein BC826DRAFT_972218 [Russula brevipes]|nr:hypothetical protein BC826DRAFT_972218 [Russula brevipes]